MSISITITLCKGVRIMHTTGPDWDWDGVPVDLGIFIPIPIPIPIPIREVVLTNLTELRLTQTLLCN